MTGDNNVAAVDDLTPGTRMIVTVDGTQVGVFNVDGKVYAYRNECPHQRGPVCTGDVHGAVDAEFESAGERVRKRVTERPAITCPRHGWEFDLESGDHLGTDEFGLEPVGVTVVDGMISLDTESS